MCALTPEKIGRLMSIDNQKSEVQRLNPTCEIRDCQERCHPQ
jgi:hypothetical protein